jgi:DNA-binding NtrC family response regulator
MTPAWLDIVEDDPGTAEIIHEVASSCGFATRRFASGKEFVAASDAVAAGVMVIDIVMPDMDGIELLGWIAANRRDSKVILISGYGKQYLDTARKLAEASGLNVPATLVKPFGIAEVEEVLDRIRPGA